MGFFKKLIKKNKGEENKVREDPTKLEEENQRLNDDLEKERKESKSFKDENKKLLAQLEELEEKMNHSLIELPPFKNSMDCMLRLLQESKANYYKGIRGWKADRLGFVHDDADGACCGALLEKCFESEANMKIFHISQKNRYIIPTVKPRVELVTADLFVDEELAKYFLGLNERGVKVTCIDHHKSSLTLPGQLLPTLKSNNILVWEKARSAASLVCKHYGLSDSISKRISLIADRCDSGKSKETIYVRKDAAFVSKLANLGGPTVDDLITDLANHGSVTKEDLKKKSGVVDLLLLYGEKIVEEKILHESKHFQVYYLDENTPPLIGTNLIGSKFGRKNHKDVYMIFKEGSSMSIRGKVKIVDADNVFSTMEKEIGGRAYSRGISGGLMLPFEEGKIEKIIGFLKRLYEHEALIKNAYDTVSSPVIRNSI